MSGELQKGEVIAGKLEVIRKIAGGGMGAVYEVEHQLTRHRRALKVLHKSQSLNRRYVERLLREASVAGRLNTPYVVETLDAGLLEDGTPYLLMEFLDGVAFIDIVERDAPLEVGRTIRIIRQVCEGMAAAHDAGIVHRDLKPENILVMSTAEGGESVKIIDFGISRFSDEAEGAPVSRLTTEGTIIGTPYYMSPEQASGLDVDARSDVYALGVILYEALTGRLPFIAETTGALFVKIGTGEHLPLKHRRRDIDPKLAAIIERAFHRKPEDRFPTARALAEALAPYADSKGNREKLRRATADYESDPPRPRTNPGVAPMGAVGDAETLEFDEAVPLQRSFGPRGRVAAPIVAQGVAFPTPASRDLPTEEIEGPAPADQRGDALPASPASPASHASRAPAAGAGDGGPSGDGAAAAEHASGPNLAAAPGADSADGDDDGRSGVSDHPSDARALAREGVPPWVGTTGLAALVAALVAAAILVVAGSGEESPPSPAVAGEPDVEAEVPVAAPEPTAAVDEDRGNADPDDGSPAPRDVADDAPPTAEGAGAAPEGASPDGPSTVGRPRMNRATISTNSAMSPSMMSSSMQTAAEAAGLDLDPYAP